MPEAICGEQELVLPSTLGQLDRVDELTLRCTRTAGLSDDQSMMVAIAVVEAVTNAIVHGNRLAEDKSVIVRYSCSPGTFKVVVHDEGEGFDLTCVWDPTTPERCMECSGRGIYIMREIMDSVEFDMSKGTTVTMIKAA